ncbi:DUF6783 domain-containing protein [Ruminococcus sp. 1001136sp1_2201st1_G3_2201SCRN_220225]|uniref:DUF6783 domain-containing protein n=1 Tax=Ruminococcus sp. 1001136sp1_2201st1_G3_2201SCRN_220225 TaxID=3141596 RepID=UPI0034A47748
MKAYKNSSYPGERVRACLKKHFRNLYAPLCGIFHQNSVAVARYGAFIRAKSPTNCAVHLAENLFQIRSKTRR